MAAIPSPWMDAVSQWTRRGKRMRMDGRGEPVDAERQEYEDRGEPPATGADREPERAEAEASTEPERAEVAGEAEESKDTERASAEGDFKQAETEQASAAPVRRQRPSAERSKALKSLLEKAKPSWSPRELKGVKAKLTRVGVRSVEDLARALQCNINDDIRAAGLHPFASSTLQALAHCLSEVVPSMSEEFKTVATNGNSNGHANDYVAAEVSGGKPHGAGRTDVAEAAVPRDEDWMLGMWLISDERIYEMRSTDDGGFREDLGGPAGAGPIKREGRSSTGLWYSQRLPSGEMLAGALDRVTDFEWRWEAQLCDGSRLRFRRTDSQAMDLQCCPSGSDAWEAAVPARRPEAYAFYSALDHKQGHRYVHFPCIGERAGDFPLIGLTAGWLPAAFGSSGDREVAAQGRGQVNVQLLGTFCDPFDATTHQSLHAQSKELAMQLPETTLVKHRYSLGAGFKVWDTGLSSTGNGLDVVARVARHYGLVLSDMKKHTLCRGKPRMMASTVCKSGLRQVTGANLVHLDTSGAPPRPLLSIICVRWHNYWSDPKHSSDYNITNDGFFMELFTGPYSVGKTLPGEVEIYTIFIRGTTDLAKLRPQHLRAMLKGKNVSAWYFLWPSDDGPAGQVHEHKFFSFCQEMERLPVRMGWPHQSSVYRMLCGKLWIPQMSLNRDFRVPPTVRVHYAEFKKCPRKATNRAMASLMRLRNITLGRPWISVEDFKGVVKLGFAWCGADVLPFKGTSSLMKNLGKLFNHRDCQNTTCLVQEMIPAVVGEFRVLVMHDKRRRSIRRETMWMSNDPWLESMVKHNVRHADVASFTMASHLTVHPKQVAARFFKGDLAAQMRAEEKALATVSHWLRWFATETPEPPQTTRIDFLVSYDGKGEAVPWTCEVGENGGSLCTVEVHGRNLAALNRAILMPDDVQRFPMEFPNKIPRNDGSKG
uniref:Uncharacterized protein n=1 Tax=Alexandrium monilatum TaxID=311494 RepID=A0A7S4QRP3_9DINO